MPTTKSRNTRRPQPRQPQARRLDALLSQPRQAGAKGGRRAQQKTGLAATLKSAVGGRGRQRKPARAGSGARRRGLFGVLTAAGAGAGAAALAKRRAKQRQQAPADPKPVGSDPTAPDVPARNEDQA